MATPEELAALEDVVDIGGVKYTFTPLTAIDAAYVIREIRKQRPNPVAVARQLAEGLPPDERRELLSRAYDDAVRARYVTDREMDDFMASLDGAMFCAWLSLKHKHPELTLEDATLLMERLGRESMAKLMATVSGLPTADPTMPTQLTTAAA